MRLLFDWCNWCFMYPEFHQYHSNATMFEKREIREEARIYRVQSSKVATNLQSRSLLTIGILLRGGHPLCLALRFQKGFHEIPLLHKSLHLPFESFNFPSQAFDFPCCTVFVFSKPVLS
jgi:hypothetical protein